MQIDYILCPESIEEKLAKKHRVTLREVRQTLLNNPRIRYAEKGYTEAEDVYAAFSQTFGGRYLSIFFIFKRSDNTAIIISAPARHKSGNSGKSLAERKGCGNEGGLRQVICQLRTFTYSSSFKIHP